MRTRRRLLTLGLLTLLLGVLGLQPALGAANGRGRIIASYRVGSGKPAPAWAQAAMDQGASHFTKAHSRADIAAVGADLDDLDMRHARFEQRYGGLPVFGGQLIAHLDKAGNLLRQSGHFYKGVQGATKPAINANNAIAVATAALGYRGQFAEKPSAQLLILPLDGRYILAYQVTLKIEDGTDATAHHQYFVNAQDGSIAWSYDSLPHDDVVGTGQSLYSGIVVIHTDLSGGVYNLRDLTRGGLYTTDMANQKKGN